VPAVGTMFVFGRNVGFTLKLRDQIGQRVHVCPSHESGRSDSSVGVWVDVYGQYWGLSDGGLEPSDYGGYEHPGR
jgi:hypothetical protein